MAVDVEDYYRRFGPMVLRRCRTLLRDEERAVDAMHDVFVQLIRQGDIEVSAPSSLLYRMATNVCLNHLRTRRRRPEDQDEELLQRIAMAGGDVESRSAARSVLELVFGRKDDPLAESTEAMAVLHLLDGMTLEEVAQEVGLSVSGVRKRLRGLKAQVTELEGV